MSLWLALYTCWAPTNNELKIRKLLLSKSASRGQNEWVMGTPYKQPRALGRLPPTIVREMYDDEILDEIAARNDTLRTPRDPRGKFATAAECAAVIRRDSPTANAAVYSNDGGGECRAVFDAAGVIHDPMLQTCLFERW
eukprot:COSAG06_NODE_5148_length_3679_cov_9.779050_3_plen_139_part_00